MHKKKSDGIFIKNMKKFKIHPLSLIFLPLAVMICGAEKSLLMLTAVIIHEIGHIIIITVSGQKIMSVTLLPCGLDISREGKSSYLTDAAVYIFGPLFNFIFSSLFIFLYPPLFPANIAFGIFNLLPVPPLDGGCALRALLRHITDIVTADAVMRAISAVTLFITYIGAIVILMLSEWNISLLLVCIMLFFVTFFEKNA